MKQNIQVIVLYIILVLGFYFLQFFGSNIWLDVPPLALITKLYVIIGVLTLLILLNAFLIKKINKHHIGSVFLIGMIAKMAVVLALVVVYQEIKQNVVQLIVAYFLVLLAEVLSFVKLLKNND